MTVQDLLNQWWGRAHTSQTAHYQTAVNHERRHLYVGITVVVLNAIVASAVFATLTETANVVPVKVIAGLISVAAIVLSAVQTHQKSGERAESHRKVAASFCVLQRDIEQYAPTGKLTSPEVDKFIADFNARYNQLVKEAPTPEETSHQKAKKTYEEDKASGKIQFPF